jgi:hypothetical protein
MYLRLAIVVALIPWASSSASATTYVGTWAANAAQCGVDQSRQNAPLVIGRGRYDQHETHCTFTSLRKSGASTWRMRARCTVAGNRQTHTFSLAVDGDALAMRDRYGVRKLVRCP